MNILIFGAAGFIGTNLTIELAKNSNNNITLVDKKIEFFPKIEVFNYSNIKIETANFDLDTDFERLLYGQNVVFHLVSTTVPTTANQRIAEELTSNVVVTAKMLDACVKCQVNRVVFMSSGGTVYGRNNQCPLKESMNTRPISSYGIQKDTIEKLLYLYNYMHNLDYRVIRLANPYGPYQRPNGVQGAVTTFTYKAMKNEKIVVYGDGSVIRDFIYIEDAIKAICQIAFSEDGYKTYNVGSGYGTSIKDVLETIQHTLNLKVDVEYKPGRMVDVPVNYLDISRYESVFGKITMLTLDEGIVKTAEFMKRNLLEECKGNE